jgi:uncharacterized membrane protein SpoIIM required for sporulation
MAPFQLKSQQFRKEREWDWRKLDSLLNRVETKGARALNDDELLAVPVLYRSALSSLSVARATSLDQGLIDYLEGLCARAYFLVYGTRPRIAQRIGGFFTRTWPMAVQSLWKETLASGLIFALGVLIGFLLVRQDPNWFYAMVDQGMAGGRDPTASAEALRKGLYDGGGQDGLSFFAAHLFTNNAQVAIFAFTLGFAFGMPTALLVAMNGTLLGGMMAVFASKGLAFEFTGWLLIHGVTELFAVILAGAAGFRIGLAVAFPGEKTRLDAAAHAGRTAGAAMAGVIIMLMFAGVLEGFGRQLIRDDIIRYSIAAATGVVWFSYFYLPRRWKVADGRA